VAVARHSSLRGRYLENQDHSWPIHRPQVRKIDTTASGYHPAVAIRNPLESLRSASRRLTSILENQAGLKASLDELSARVDALAAEAQADALATDARTVDVGAELKLQMSVLRAIFEDEPGNRRRLWEMRSDPEYMRPFEEDHPLVTVIIPTYSNAEGLAKRSIPSVLAQTHENLEVIVVGDAATPDVEEAARSFDDPRVHFSNLTIRGPYPSDPVDLWHVAGTGPSNEALRLANGQWIACNCDDDVFRPDQVELLLGEARKRSLELVYGKIRRLDPQGADIIIGTFPPDAPGQYGAQAALRHRGLRMFPHELVVFGEPADWVWLRRMIRLGVRVGMIDDIVVDYYPSQLWGTPARPAGLLGQ
jgi:hypothetical protein